MRELEVEYNLVCSHIDSLVYILARHCLCIVVMQNYQTTLIEDGIAVFCTPFLFNVL